MAKILVRNTREHDIDLFATAKNGVAERVTIPAGSFNTEEKAVVPGECAVDEEFLKAARSGSKAVQGMFSEGWLVAKTVAAPAPSPAGNTGGNAGNDGGGAGNDGGKK